MIQTEEKERTWVYLLPDGITTAENMLQGCEKMREQTGHKFSAEAFRSLVRKDVIIKINKITHSIYSKENASKETTAQNK